MFDIAELPSGKMLHRNVLYVCEDESDVLGEEEQKMNDTGNILFDRICDEIFGDG